MNRLVMPVGGSFIVGYTLATLIHTNDFLFSWLQPLKAATSLTNDRQPVDIVPVSPGDNKPMVDEATTSALLGQNRSREIMRHGYPSLDNIRMFDNYVLSYDRRNRVPNWVFEHLTYARLKPSSEDVDRGKSEFKEDPFVHPYFRATNADYKGSGYDRGHMAAAANHRSSQKLMDQTFFLSNIAPQVGVGFNRDKWNDLEKEVRLLAKNHDNIWVCTGPLYLPKKESDSKMYVKYEVIGSQHVAVPTHYFKVILCEKQGTYSLYSYVLPNQPCDSSTPLKSYQVPIDSIERAAGFILFDKIPRKSIKYINGK